MLKQLQIDKPCSEKYLFTLHPIILIMKNLFYFFVCTLLLSCGHNSNDMDFPEEGAYDVAYEEAAYMMEAPEPQQPPSPAKLQAAVEKKLIKTGELSLQVENTAETYRQVIRQLKEYSAYIQNESQRKEDKQLSFYLSIRVPSEQFDSLFRSLAQPSHRVEEKIIRVEDVTERYYDLSTRIKNQKALEDRYRELLEKATAIEDILEIENNLNEIRTRIEVQEGQLNYLSKQIRFSTISLHFSEPVPYTYTSEAQPAFGPRMKNSIVKGWLVFVSFVVGMVGLWPFLLSGALLFLLIRQIKKRRKKQKATD